MWDLDWQASGFSKPYMREIITACDYLFLRSPTHINPVKKFLGREPDGINSDFNLEVFFNL